MTKEADMTRDDKGMVEKFIRAKVIHEYMREAGYTKCVCFTCGNAAIALRAEGIHVLEVGPHGFLDVHKWFTPAEIHRIWPDYFDATPGHLPAHLMVKIAMKLREIWKDEAVVEMGIDWRVMTGSGETIVCARWAFPNNRIIVGSDGTPATERYYQSALEQIIDEDTP